MSETFFKFPRTPHLISVTESRMREDRVYSDAEREEFLSSEIVVEEKIDGANVGLSVTANGSIRAQNRGSYIEQPSPPQFRPLWSWVAKRRLILARTLGTKLILFGEWCFAVHSIRYNHLPDWFIGFDVYDLESNRFWSSERRDLLLRSLEIHTVARIDRRRFNIDELYRLLSATRSAYGSEPIEGLYLRSEANGWLERRAKLVRPNFMQSMDEHWSSRPLQKNVVDL